ncbi:unnamed protein product [Thlaspi arvense]|uniref:FRIGIDA-like protein n=1 Tax=Thlaspi arvense TaxID=13288 RepID=A0AAU9SPG1_THLAR|nr:unnamed protein product [Thlaspi arvense]
MASRNGSLIPRLGYANYSSVREEQPSLLPSPATIPRLHQRHQSEQRRGEFPAVIRTETINKEFTIGQSKHPQFLKSIDELTAFSAAVDAFKRQYDDLQKHMDYIENAIESKLKSNGIEIAAASSSFHSQSSPPRNVVPAAVVCQSPKETTETVPEMSNKPEGQRLCSKGLRKYIYSNISDRAKLMKEIPEALKLAKEPAKFVLECIGKFYLQGRKAFANNNSPMIPARKASLLILECFLLMLDPGEEKNLKFKIESSVKDEADAAAFAWKRRLMNEGGLAAAEAIDARGLLLLIACFGVPSSFGNTDLLDLVRQSGAAEIAGALKRSPFLATIVSGIVDSSIKRGTQIKALEMVYTFGLEDKFPPSSLLTSFLRMSKESFEKAKRKTQSPMAFKKAIEKQLAALSSVMRCLETHKLDPTKEAPGWQIKEQMVKLKKDARQVDKQMEEQARSISLMEEAELTKRLYSQQQQMKRPRLSDMEMPTAPVASSSYSPIYRDRSFPSHNRNEDRDEISALVNSYLGPSSSFPHRSSLRRSPEYMVPPSYEQLHSSSYTSVQRRHSPVHEQRLPREYSPQIPYGIQRVYRHSPSVERYLGLPHHRSPRNSSQDSRGGM